MANPTRTDETETVPVADGNRAKRSRRTSGTLSVGGRYDKCIHGPLDCNERPDDPGHGVSSRVHWVCCNVHGKSVLLVPRAPRVRRSGLQPLPVRVDTFATEGPRPSARLVRHRRFISWKHCRDERGKSARNTPGGSRSVWARPIVRDFRARARGPFTYGAADSRTIRSAIQAANPGVAISPRRIRRRTSVTPATEATAFAEASSSRAEP